MSSGKNYSKQIISDESNTNQNNSTKNDQKIPKEIRLTRPKKMKKTKTIKQIILVNTDTTQTSKYGTPYSIIKVYGHITKSMITST